MPALEEERDVDEEDVPAAPQTPCPGARLSSADEHARRPPGAEGPAGTRSQAADAGVGVGSAVRLRRGREFDRMYREGRLTRGALLVFRTAPNSGGRGRWGFVVSKKMQAHAVDRNRTRRRLASLARTWDSSASGDTIVAITRRGASATFPQLSHEFEQTARRIGLEKRP